MIFGNIIGGLAKSIALGQVRTYLPAIGGALAAIGITNNQVNYQSFEGSVYYIISSLFVIVPAAFSYLDKKSVQSLVQTALVAVPGTPLADAVAAKVSVPAPVVKAAI